MSFDDKFVARLQRRDKQAFGELYKQTVDQLYRYVAWRYSLPKQEILDLVSDFYVKLRRVLDKYDVSYKFESFFWTVFKNMLKDHFKKKKEVHNTEKVMDRDTTDPDQLLKAMQGSFEMSAIKSAMENLDEMSYQVIVMKYVEQMNYEEIAMMLNIQQEAVRKRLSRALQKVRASLNI